MKKYVKPELFYEEFELTQHIADCAWELDFQNLNSCKTAFPDPDYLSGMSNLFTVPNGCDYIPIGYEGSNVDVFVCYYGGGEGANVFNS